MSYRWDNPDANGKGTGFAVNLCTRLISSYNVLCKKYFGKTDLCEGYRGGGGG
jgi:hypothetical protein